MRTFVFLQEQGGQSAQGGGGSLNFLLMMGLIFVVMYFFMIRPQQKRQKELRKFREDLKKGDKVVTSGGIYGKIVEIRDDNKVFVEVDKDVKLLFDKSTILKDMSDAPAK
jgi:preprotein translocase subunit YajC